MGKRFFIFLTLLMLSSLFSKPRVRLMSPKVSKMDRKRRIKYGLKSPPVSYYVIVIESFFFSHLSLLLSLFFLFFSLISSLLLSSSRLPDL